MTPDILATEAAAHWGGTPLSMIRDRENAVFRMALPDGRFAALRLHRMGYQTAAAIRSELWFCGALADKGLPVPRVLTARDGTGLVMLSTGRMASAVEWLAGEPQGYAEKPLPGTSADQARQHHALGRLMAQIHDATEDLSLPPEFERPFWDVDGLTGETPFWGRFWDHPALTPNEVTQMQEARAFLRSALQARTTPLMPIHADVLRENILVNGDALSLIDFDDSGIGFPLYDLGTALSQNLYEPAVAELKSALVEGYRTLRPADMRMVEVFTLARTLASVGWTMPRLAVDHPTIRGHIDRALMCARQVMG